MVVGPGHDAAVLVVKNPPVGVGPPHPSAGVFHHVPAEDGGEICLHGIGKLLEAVAVETSYSVVGAEPHIALPVLCNGKGFVAGQAVVGGVVAENGGEAQERLGRVGERQAGKKGYEKGRFHAGGIFDKNTKETAITKFQKNAAGFQKNTAGFLDKRHLVGEVAYFYVQRPFQI